jgi:large subunit ribosomal protein L24
VILDSLNIAKKHTTTQGGGPNRRVQQAGIIDKYMPMDASAVALWCAKHNGPSRAGYKIEDGVKVRICRQCGEKI